MSERRSRESLTCLACKVFICVSRLHLNGAIRRKQSYMFVSPVSKEEICLLCAKGIRNKDEIKRKLTLMSSRRLESRSPVILFGPTLCAVILLIEKKKH